MVSLVPFPLVEYNEPRPFPIYQAEIATLTVATLASVREVVYLNVLYNAKVLWLVTSWYPDPFKGAQFFTPSFPLWAEMITDRLVPVNRITT